MDIKKGDLFLVQWTISKSGVYITHNATTHWVTSLADIYVPKKAFFFHICTNSRQDHWSHLNVWSDPLNQKTDYE